MLRLPISAMGCSQTQRRWKISCLVPLGTEKSSFRSCMLEFRIWALLRNPMVEIQHGVGGISVRCKTRLQVPDSRVQAWSQQSCLRRDKIQYFGKVLQNSPLTSHKMRLNRAILTMTLPCQ